MQFHQHEQNRRFYLTFAAAALFSVVACQDTPNSVGPPLPGSASATGVLAPGQSRWDVTSAIQEDWIRTPAGLYHKSCVHEIPAGAKVDINRVVKLRTGVSYQTPKCAYAPIRSVPAIVAGGTAKGSTSTQSPVLNNWIEYTSAFAAPGNMFRHIEADFIAPSPPTGAYTTGKTYFTFPGLQNGTFIIQPVLQYGSNGAFGGSYWTLASWHCSQNPDCFYSTPMVVSVGESLHGDVTATNCGGGICDWTITGIDLTSPAQTVYTISDNDNYTNAVGGSVEVYNLTSCSDLPGGSFFWNIAVNDQNGPVSPTWSGIVQSNPIPSCYFHVDYTATAANLYCCSPPPPFSASISGKQYISRYESAQYTATPTGGTSPYTYQWRARMGPSQGNFGAWQSWYSTGSQNFTYVSVSSCGIAAAQLEVLVTDASSSTADALFYSISVTNPC